MAVKRPSAARSNRRRRRMLDNTKARAQAEARAEGSKAKNDEDRAKNECLLPKLPAHDLMDDIQFHHTPSNLDHSPVAVAVTEVNDLASALQLTAIAEQTDASATNAIVVAVPENKLQQNLKSSPFLKLPPEVRCLVYEQVFLEIVEGAELVAFSRQWADRAYQSALVREQVNALPHTCRIVRKECAPIYEKLSYSANDSRIIELEDVLLKDSERPTSGSPWDRSQELEDLIDQEASTKTLGPPWYVSQVTAAVCSMRAVGDIDRVVMHIENNIKENIAENIAKSERRHAKNLVQAKLWDVCIGVQNRLHDGTGVRTAFVAEVEYQMGVEIPHHTPITGRLVFYYVRFFSVLHSAQRLNKRNRAPRSSGVVKSRRRQFKWRSKRSYRQSTG